MTTLHWSPRSPYVRKVMVGLHEKGLSGDVKTVRTYADPLVLPEPFLEINPLGKIPTLEREGHEPIFDSRVILEWADMASDTGPVLFPPERESRLTALTDEALGTGMIETGILLLIERFLREPDKQDPRMIAACERKFISSLDYLEGAADRLSSREFDVGQLSIGVALCYLDFRFSAFGWRGGRSRLAAWHETFEARPSVQATIFRDDPRPAG